MYGMVNRSLEDLVESRYGVATWERVKAAAGVDVDIFVSSEGYPDEWTVRLVVASAQELGIGVPEFLEEFGRHWILKTAITGYPDLMASGGRTLREFLINLPVFHQRVGLLFPHLSPPEFACSEIGERSLLLHYYSTRQGLTPFVKGLLYGLGEMFATPVRVESRAMKASGADHDEFLIQW